MRITNYTVELSDKRNVLVKEKGINYKTTKLDNTGDIVEMMNDIYRIWLKAEEHMYMLAMDTKCHPIGVFFLSKGTVGATLVSPREVFVRLLLCGASRFVVVHNHPSGDPTPSKEDLKITQRLIECSELMGVGFLDHIIIGDGRCYSMQEKRFLETERGKTWETGQE